MKTTLTLPHALKRSLIWATGNRLAQQLLEALATGAEYLMGVGSASTVTTSGERRVLESLSRHGADPFVVFDVGANRGQFLELTAEVLGPQRAQIHCFEPATASFGDLRARAAGLPRVFLNNVALAATTGTRILYSNAERSGLASLTHRRLDHFGIGLDRTEAVTATTLDAYCAERGIDRIDLLKLDVEGHELDVLAGGARALREGIVRRVLFEFGGCNIDTRTFLQDFYYLLTESGFNIFRVTPSGYLFPLDGYHETFERFRTSLYLASRTEDLSPGSSAALKSAGSDQGQKRYVGSEATSQPKGTTFASHRRRLFGVPSLLGRGLRRWMTAALDKPLPPPTPGEVELVAELRHKIQDLALPRSSSEAASESEWADNARRLCTLIRDDDPRRFLRWDVVRKTMFVSNAWYIRTELAYLKSKPDWQKRWVAATQESPVGHPTPCLYLRRSSANLLHHAYHVARFEETTGQRVTDFNLIVEFGGGYGSMCRLLHNLGYRGRYIIYDLPHLCALQEFYLRALGLQASADPEGRDSQVTSVSSLGIVRESLTTATTGQRRLLIATWSLSEVPVDLSASFLRLVSGFDALFIAYQRRFGEVDNVERFNRLQEQLPEFCFREVPIGHLPDNWYLFGTRKQPSGSGVSIAG